jgi:hypothetical protein
MKLSNREKHKLIYKNKIRCTIDKDPNFKRMVFVRYADDFLIGVISSHKDCIELRDKIYTYLKESLNLELNKDKIIITHAETEKALFLGTYIRITPYSKRKMVKYHSNGKFIKRLNTSLPQFLAPINILLERFKSKGFLKSNGNPTRVGKLIHYENHRIVNYFKTIWTGLNNYYAFVDNYSKFVSFIQYSLLYSCALTLAAKLKLKTKKKVFNKFGKFLTIKDAQGKTLASFPTVVSYSKRKVKFNNVVNYNPLNWFDKISNTSYRSQDSFNKPCQICGKTKKIQMHHVRALNKAIPKTFISSIMSKMNRKQIPVCRTCHWKIHNGKYDGSVL